MSAFKHHKTSKDNMKNNDNKDNRFYVVMSEWVLNQDIMKGSQVVLAYLIGLANSNKKANKKAHAIISTKKIAAQLNMTIRSVQHYLKELTDNEILSKVSYGRNSAYTPNNLDTDAKAIITDEVLKSNYSIAYKIAHGLLVVKGLKTDSHSFAWPDMQALAEYMGVSVSSAYRYIHFLEAQSLISRVSRCNFKCIDRYSKEYHDNLDLQRYNNIKKREKLINDLIEMNDNLAPNERARADRALASIYASIK